MATSIGDDTFVSLSYRVGGEGSARVFFEYVGPVSEAWERRTRRRPRLSCGSVRARYDTRRLTLGAVCRTSSAEVARGVVSASAWRLLREVGDVHGLRADAEPYEVADKPAVTKDEHSGGRAAELPM